MWVIYKGIDSIRVLLNIKAPLLIALGIASMAVSSFGVITTHNYKRLIAYASINHAGVIAATLTRTTAGRALVTMSRRLTTDLGVGPFASALMIAAIGVLRVSACWPVSGSCTFGSSGGMRYGWKRRSLASGRQLAVC